MEYKGKEIPVLFFPESDFIEFYWWKHHDDKYSNWFDNYYCNHEDVLSFVEEKFDKLSIELGHTATGEIGIKEYNGISKTDKDLLFRYSVNLDTKRYRFTFYWQTSENLDNLVKEYVNFLHSLQVKEDSKSVIYMVVMQNGELDLRPFNINIPEMDIELNYGTEWKEKHDYLFETLTSDRKKGIVLLHGDPGTGKSMYIRYLSSLLHEHKEVIYMPNQLINSITDPTFLPLMTDHPGSILVIEDAEEALKARKAGGYTVDKLLNLADGIISDFLGIQIICTFNSPVSVLDEALLRKGRLILKHEFKKLDKDDAQKLAIKLGFDCEIDKPMTLAEIYNIDDKFSEGAKSDNRKPVGF